MAPDTKRRSRHLLLLACSVIFVVAVEVMHKANLPLMPVVPILAIAGVVLLCVQLNEIVRSVKEKKNKGDGGG